MVFNERSGRQPDPLAFTTPAPASNQPALKFSFLFLISLFLIVGIVGCRGSSDGPGVVVDPGSDSPGQLRQTRVDISSTGTLSYSGSGDFSGLTVVGEGLSAGAGGYLEIKLNPGPVVTGGYVPVGNLYSLKLYDSAGTLLDIEAGGAGGPAIITLSVPYKANVVSQAGVAPADLVLLRNGQLISATVSPERAVMTAALAGFSEFVVAYLNIPPTAMPHPLPLLELAWDGYSDAPKVIDPSGSALTDPARGIAVVQVGERVLLRARGQDVSGYNYTSLTWDLVARPAGSGAVLDVSGGSDGQRLLVPDQVGRYRVKLTAANAGADDEQEITITAGSYSSYADQAGTVDNFCVLCHGGGVDMAYFGHIKDIYGRQILRDLVGPWSGSNHAAAYNNLPAADRNNTVCLNCHTTGFLLADRSGNGSEDYPLASGFDDFITNWATPATAAIAAPHLTGVACEACHGPGGSGGAPPSSGFQHDFKASLSQGPCMVCHSIKADDPAIAASGRPYFYGWEGDLHNEAHRVQDDRIRVADAEPCYHCHVGQYFIGRAHGKTLTPGEIERPEGVTCVVCHDPHQENDNPYQLRLLGQVAIPLSGNGGDGGAVRYYEAGKAAVCYSCHNAYLTLPLVGADLHGNQAEMMEGIGGYPYGQNLENRTHGGRLVADKCINCHMVSEHQGQKVTTHQRRLYSGGADFFSADNYTTSGCATSDCHQGALALPVAGNRFDFNGRTTEIRDGLSTLQQRINTLVNRTLDSPIAPSYSDAALGEEKRLAVNRAAYNYLFVYRDGSYGIHNYPYAARLLELSMADLENWLP